uniref:MIP09690p n=1 Tax=Drosophila melanogaster TaxID=7227 RepID=C0PV83_DROME|nr:MIP09690p [Drosophila melanogaster]
MVTISRHLSFQVVSNMAPSSAQPDPEPYTSHKATLVNNLACSCRCSWRMKPLYNNDNNEMMLLPADKRDN